jgi:peptidyl-prolyl cis-trans isomerase SurA
MEENLPVEVREKIVTMEKGEISQPVETEDGIYILQVTDKSQILTITEDDTIINVKFFLFESTEEELAQNNTFQKLSTHFGSEKICQSPIEIGAELGAVEANEFSINRIGSLPDQIKNSLLPLEIGYGTNFIEDPDGMVSYVLCEKRIPEVNVPDFDAMLANMTNSRLQLFATRHLRDLRRDAIIDFR